MKRRTLLQNMAALVALPLLPACAQEFAATGDTSETQQNSIAADPGARSNGANQSPGDVKMLEHAHSYWRDKVSPAAYAILFDEDTEAAFSSPLDKEDRVGTFVCAACKLPLFDSVRKFDSGTGWPSFTAPIAGHMRTKKDFKLVWPRTEYHCARCGGHQGHVFDDGPEPRGERWCNNGLALAFVPQGQPLPALRG
ncbi:MAG: peptide-methionine (R)-S-oxide reductase MsrB [Dokdonella sp.]